MLMTFTEKEKKYEKDNIHNIRDDGRRSGFRAGVAS